jgi:tRNA threonylcarbamoyladenosine modification (KEOPS) complex  Pcc1 subunit
LREFNMRRLQGTLVLLALLALLCVGAQVQAAGGSGNVHARSVLVRVDDADDPDAKGKIDFYVKKGEYTLRIKAQKLNVDAVDFVLLDADGVEVEVIRSDVAVETDDGEGTAHIKLYSKKGDTFEGNGTDPGSEIDDALVGMLVGVRNAADADDDIDFLVGVIPDLVKGGPKKHKHKHKGFGDDEKGRLKFEWRHKDGRIRLSIKANTDLDEGTQVKFKLFYDGDEYVLGTGAANEEGKVKMKLRTDHGDWVPLAILKDVGELDGTQLRICWDHDGDPGTDDEVILEQVLDF